jgi:outer membrane protein TolC
MRLLCRRLVGTALVIFLLLLLLCASPAAAQRQVPPSPLTLPQAIQYALDNYPTIRASLARVSAQQAGVALSRTAYLPRLDSTALANRATRNNVPSQLLPGSLIPPISGSVDPSSGSNAWSSAASLLLSWEPIDFGARGAAVEFARTQVNQAMAGADLARLDAGINAADAFLGLAVAQETVRAARANLDRIEVFANSVAVLVQNQLRPGADESRARADLAAARILLIQAERTEQVSRANLGQWLGIPAANVQIAADSLMQAPSPAAPSDVAAHPLAVAQMASVSSVRALQTVLNRSYVPRFNFQSAYSWRASGWMAPNPPSGLQTTATNWAVGLTATFPIFDFFALRERKRIEAHNETAERALYDRVLQNLRSQSEQASAELEGARQVAENTPVELEAARVLEQQTVARYQAGLATIVEVADSQRLLLQAEVDDAVARLGIWRALVSEAAAKGDLSDLLR